MKITLINYLKLDVENLNLLKKGNIKIDIVTYRRIFVNDCKCKLPDLIYYHPKYYYL